MDDDRSTLNARREGALGREIDALRRRYLDQRETLARLASEAPSEALAEEYVRLQHEIDGAVARLTELTRVSPRRTAPGTIAAAAAASATGDLRHTTLPAVEPRPSPLNSGELRHAPQLDAVPTEREPNGARVLAILAAGVVVLLLLGWLAWRFLARPEEPVTDPAGQQTALTETIAEEPGTVAEESPAPAASALQVAPASHDYGAVRKGTRSTHKFQLTNRSSAAMTLQVSRSQCRCLWFDYPKTIPAQATGAITVTVDGARANAGSLQETVTVSTREDPSTVASLRITADIIRDEP